MTRATDFEHRSRGGINGFLSVIGFLSAAALPLVRIFLGGEWVTIRLAIGAYIGTMAVLFVCFLIMMIVGRRLPDNISSILRTLPAAYTTLATPIVCLLILLTVVYILPPSVYLPAILAVHLMFLVLWGFFRKRFDSSVLFARVNRWVLQLLPLFYAAIFWSWFRWRYPFPIGLRSAAVLIAVATAYVAFLRSERLRNFRLQLRTHWWICLLLGLFLIGLMFQPGLPIDRYHSSPLLAPLHDVADGKWILVDTLSQYGIGVVYFLRTVFSLFRLPVFYPGLAAVVNGLFILQYAVLFLILHRATKSFFLSLAGIGTILYFNYFAVAWPSMLCVPAQGPLRYGMTYLVLGAGWIGMNRQGRVWRIVELALLGAASLWSLEAFLYAFVPLNVLHLTNDVVFSAQPKAGLSRFGGRLAQQSVMILLCWGVWWLGTRISSGAIPDPAQYLGVFQKTAATELYRNPLDFHSFWTAPATAVYIGTILAVVYTGWRNRKRMSAGTAALLAGLSAAGMLHYLYYFIFDIDYHLSLLSTPLILVIVLWVSVSQDARATEGIPRLTKWTFGAAVVVSLWLCAILTSPWFFSGIRNSFLYQILSELPAGDAVAFADPYRAEPSNDSVRALVELTGKYAPAERSIALFAQSDDQVETLLLTGKTHILDMTDPLMCSLSLPFSARIMDQARGYAGKIEYIFLDSSEGALLDIQKEAFRLLTEGTSYLVVDRMGDILVYKRDRPVYTWSNRAVFPLGSRRLLNRPPTPDPPQPDAAQNRNGDDVYCLRDKDQNQRIFARDSERLEDHCGHELIYPNIAGR